MKKIILVLCLIANLFGVNSNVSYKVTKAFKDIDFFVVEKELLISFEHIGGIYKRSPKINVFSNIDFPLLKFFREEAWELHFKSGKNFSDTFNVTPEGIIREKAISMKKLKEYSSEYLGDKEIDYYKLVFCKHNLLAKEEKVNVNMFPNQNPTIDWLFEEYESFDSRMKHKFYLVYDIATNSEVVGILGISDVGMTKVSTYTKLKKG
ncbi:MAG: hypothetical protein S4CHLAM20_14100 [Chlamydiia bacterium]|nr:hypothetical protein [Chlamydiia bacterium]